MGTMNFLQEASAYANIFLAVLTPFTLVVLIIYTCETRKLRLLAQKQLEVLMMPLLTFDSLSIAGSLESPVIRNVGKGAAFNIEIESLDERWMCKDYPRVLGPEQKVRITLVLGGDQLESLNQRTVLSEDVDNTLEPMDQRTFSITCQGPTGKKYRSTLSVQLASGDLERCTAITVNWHGFEKLRG
jgi:hypothetical protein